MPSVEPFLRLIAQNPLDASYEDVDPYVLIFEGMRSLLRSNTEDGPRIVLPHGGVFDREVEDPVPRPRPVDVPVAKPTPPTASPLPESPPSTMALPTNLQQAVDAKIQAELKPVAEKLLRLKQAIDGFSLVSKSDAERRVSNSVLVALGQEAVTEDPKLASVTKELRDALTIVSELVGLPFVEARKEVPPDPPPTLQPKAPEPQRQQTADDILREAGIDPSTPVPLLKPEAKPNFGAIRTTMVEDVPASTPVPPSQPVVTQRRPQKATSEESIAHAKRLITEAEALKKDISLQHPTRLEPLLQALIAEVRLLMDRIGPDQDVYLQKVTSLINLVNALKFEGKVEGYIRGLAFGATGDWEHIAFKARQKVAKYDNDVSRSEHSTTGSGGKKSKPPKAEEAPVSHQWPDLPRLHKLSKPILLAGGMIIPEKLVSIKERWGLDLEWHEIDHDNPRASQNLVTRIRTGKVGAIIILEGVMRHSTFRPVTEVCNLNKVPYAMGDKAGIASLQGAFAELERKLVAA